MTKKNIALIQLGKRCTLFYEEMISKKKEQKSTFHLVKYYTNFELINQYLPYQFNYLVPKLSTIIKNLKHDDISFIIMPNITLHHTSDKLTEIDLFIHPIRETINKLKQLDVKEVYLFGSIYTMNNMDLKKQFNNHQIKILDVDKKDQLFIDDFRKKVYHFSESKAELNKYKKMIQKYSLKNNIVIACTELSIFTPINKNNIFDTAHIQIEKIFTNLNLKK